MAGQMEPGNPQAHILFNISCFFGHPRVFPGKSQYLQSGWYHYSMYKVNHLDDSYTVESIKSHEWWEGQNSNHFFNFKETCYVQMAVFLKNDKKSKIVVS